MKFTDRILKYLNSWNKFLEAVWLTVCINISNNASRQTRYSFLLFFAFSFSFSFSLLFGAFHFSIFLRLLFPFFLLFFFLPPGFAPTGSPFCSV
ncbi:hypothetical protein I7I53_04357 [Histoplasma capsulatum var. duboisii H88]|uniref:Uncharacterized protein n=1 Tax=Ajellomyces capsulatus (strain H88) TaxID=544711 RepID=A0A8A1LW89_AJEC8|nr:hypothetical protein I7I53_04357 [Histoplasma capsulatum var. duboisii H88]